ncbi:MAG: YqaA family protein [Pseudomonadota bacterium]
MISYLTMFGSAFLAATIFPAQSELVLIGFLTKGQQNVAALLLVASVGNVLGSVVNYYLGIGVQTFRDHKWFPACKQQLNRAETFYHRYGRWSLLLARAPIIGDPLTVIAGIMREPLWSFLLLVTISKASRYLALAAIALQVV